MDFGDITRLPLTPDRRFIFRDMDSPHLDVPTTSQLLRNALTIVRRQTGHTFENGKLKPMSGSREEFLEFIDPDKPLESEQMAKAVTMQFQRTLGRSPEEAELERFTALMAKNVREAGRVTRVWYTLAAVFLLPEVIFRYEVGGALDDEGKARVKPAEIADALAYALTDSPPPQWLVTDAAAGKLNGAAAGKLNGAAEVAAAVRNMFADEKRDKPRVLRFFHEYFEYPNAADVFKNPEDFRKHTPQILVSDTDNLIRWILHRDKNVLRELLTTSRAFVNTRYDSNKWEIVRGHDKDPIHLSYSLPPDWQWTAEQPLEMPAGTRAGVLTQPSWLVAWSMNQDNHAILRQADGAGAFSRAQTGAIWLALEVEGN